MKYKKSVYRSLAMVTQLGFCVLTPVFLGIFAGSYLDSRYGTHLTLVFLIGETADRPGCEGSQDRERGTLEKGAFRR